VKGGIKLAELLNAHLSSLHTPRETQLCLDSLGLERSDAICEIGLGTGLTSLILSRRCRKVIAIDVSEPLIRFLQEQPQPSNLEFYAADGTKPAPKELVDQFDKCICIDVMEHVEDPAELFAFISQILKRCGRGVITFPINNPHHGRNYFTKDNLLNLIVRSDLEVQVKILKLDRLGSLLESIPGKFQSVLVKRSVETDEFDGTLCFQMMQKPKRVHAFYKLAIGLLFKVHQRPFYEDESGNRALLLVQKGDNERV